MIIAKILWTLVYLLAIYLYGDLFITELLKNKHKLNNWRWYIATFLVCYMIVYAIMAIIIGWGIYI